MGDPRTKKLGDLLTNYCVAVQPGDTVCIWASHEARPLMTETYRAVIEAGGHPFVLERDDDLSEILMKYGSDEQISYLSPIGEHIATKFDKLISIKSRSNTRAFSRIDPSKQRLLLSRVGKFRQLMSPRTVTGEMLWVGTIFPTHAYAQDAEMSLTEFEDFYYDSCLLNTDDPVAEWRAVAESHQAICDWLNARKELRVVGPNVNLRLSIEGRKWINGNGRVNMPCGEIFTGPVEDSAEGWIRYTYPAIHEGREVEGVELYFENGRVEKATARKNEAYLNQILDTDAGSRFLGEFAIGTNRNIQNFTKSILFDEKIAGTIHMAVGSSYPDSGGKNRSTIHWDMICEMRDGGQIYADDELFYDSGKFLVG